MGFWSDGDGAEGELVLRADGGGNNSKISGGDHGWKMAMMFGCDEILFRLEGVWSCTQEPK